MLVADVALKKTHIFPQKLFLESGGKDSIKVVVVSCCFVLHNCQAGHVGGTFLC